VAGSTGTKEMVDTLIVLIKRRQKWFHKYDLSLDFKVVYDASMSIIGMAFHNDGKRWK